MIRPLALLLLLAACAPPANTPEAACDQESWNDPEVKLLMDRQLGNDWLAWNSPNAVPDERNRAKRACLARRGIIPAGGGVEPVRRPNSSFNNLF